MTNKFYDTLLESTTTSVREQKVVLEILNEFAEAIKDFGNSNFLAERLDLIHPPAEYLRINDSQIDCILERGMLINMGQEWRVKLRATNRNYEQILLRAYIPVHGYPVMLDLYEEDMIECKTEATLRRRLTEFLKQPSTTDLIALFASQ